MADSSTYTLWLVITAQNKAIEEINKLWKSVDNVKWWITKLSETTKKTLKTIWTTATAIAWSVVALWKTFVDSALENEPLQRSYERLTETAQISADEMLKAMRKASKWTVSDTKLMASANTALSLNVVKSADDMATLMEIARVKWQAMWRSMEEALDDIVRWLWRASPMILDNLWIVINQTEAQEEYAKQLWKTASQLTEAEKKQALVNAVVKQGKQELLETWELQLTMAERLQVVNAQRENMKNTLGEALLPIVQRVLEAITPIIERVSERIEQNPELTANIMLTVWAVAWLVAVLSWLALALPWIATAIGVLSWPIWRVLAWITALAIAWKNNWWWIQDKTKEAVADIEERIWPRIEKIRTRFEEHSIEINTYRFALREWIKWILSWAIEFITWSLTMFFDWLSIMMSFFSWDFQSAREWLWQFLDDFAITVDNTMTEAFGDMRTNIKNWFLEWYNTCVDLLQRLYNFIQSIVAWIRNAWNSMTSAVSSFVDRWVSEAKSLIKRMSSWKKAWWWVVYWWETYLVWENWPELFTPSQRWMITPNNQITNNNGIEINISWVSVRNDEDINALANEIVRQIKLEKDFGIA